MLNSSTFLRQFFCALVVGVVNRTRKIFFLCCLFSVLCFFISYSAKYGRYKPNVKAAQIANATQMCGCCFFLSFFISFVHSCVHSAVAFYVFFWLCFALFFLFIFTFFFLLLTYFCQCKYCIYVLIKIYNILQAFNRLILGGNHVEQSGHYV